MKIRIIYILSLLFLSLSAFPQFLVNQGQINVPSGFLVINGDYVNQGSGNIILDGTIQLTGNWTNNVANTVMSAPNGTGMVIFNGSGLHTIGGSSASYLNFEGITINAGDTIQVQAGMGVTAAGPCNFNTPLILKTTTTPYRPKMATFINNGTVTGNITMEMSYTSTGSSAQGVGRGLFFSSPVGGAKTTIFNVTAGTNIVWFWDQPNKKLTRFVANGVSFNPLDGYLLRSPTSNVFSFTGPPNASNSYTVTGFTKVAGNPGWFLTGNPYPAVINWQTVSTKTNIVHSIWYRTSTLSGSMRVDTWNDSSMVGTGNNGTSVVDGFIAPMQGFYVRVKGDLLTGTITIANSDRGHNWGTASFLKSGSIPNKDVFRLAVYSDSSKDENILVQADSASDYFDGWDSQKLFLSDPAIPEIYTLSPEGNKLVIQSVKPVTDEKLFAVGINIGKAGSYKFKVDMSQATGNFFYYLEDKQQNIIQDLQSNPDYSFNSDPVTDSLGSRFVLHVNILPTYKSGQVTDGLNNSFLENNKLLIYSFGKEVYVKNCNPNSQLIIYNLLGSEVYNSITNSDQEVISLSNPAGIYLVKIEMGNGWKIQKVILN